MAKRNVGLIAWLVIHVLIFLSFLINGLISLVLKKNMFLAAYGSQIASIIIPSVMAVVSLVIIIAYWLNRTAMFYSSLVYLALVLVMNVVYAIQAFKVSRIVIIVIALVVGYFIFRYKNSFQK